MKQKNLIRKMYLILTLLSLSTCIAFAAPANADTVWTNIITFVCTWVVRLGFAIAFFGGLTVASSFYEDNPDRKVMGVRLIGAGLFFAAVGTSPSIFGIV